MSFSVKIGNDEIIKSSIGKIQEIISNKSFSQNKIYNNHGSEVDVRVNLIMMNNSQQNSLQNQKSMSNSMNNSNYRNSNSSYSNLNISRDNSHNSFKYVHDVKNNSQSRIYLNNIKQNDIEKYNYDLKQLEAKYQQKGNLENKMIRKTSEVLSDIKSIDTNKELLIYNFENKDEAYHKSFRTAVTDLILESSKESSNYKIDKKVNQVSQVNQINQVSQVNQVNKKSDDELNFNLLKINSNNNDFSLLKDSINDYAIYQNNKKDDHPIKKDVVDINDIFGVYDDSHHQINNNNSSSNNKIHLQNTGNQNNPYNSYFDINKDLYYDNSLNNNQNKPIIDKSNNQNTILVSNFQVENFKKSLNGQQVNDKICKLYLEQSNLNIDLAVTNYIKDYYDGEKKIKIKFSYKSNTFDKEVALYDPPDTLYTLVYQFIPEISDFSLRIQKKSNKELKYDSNVVKYIGVLELDNNDILIIQ